MVSSVASLHYIPVPMAPFTPAFNMCISIHYLGNHLIMTRGINYRILSSKIDAFLMFAGWPANCVADGSPEMPFHVFLGRFYQVPKVETAVTINATLLS